MEKNKYNIKGVKYISTPEIYILQYIEKVFKNIIKSYGYNEIKLPLIEKTNLFKQTLGKNSDIISKEMFSFKDKDSNFITLLPEGTTSCVKSLILNGSLRNTQKKKVWYFCPMFRREKPQEGRNRLFYQLGMEAFGYNNYEIDLEHILIINKLLKLLNINDIILEINCINNSKKKNLYKTLIKKFLKQTKIYLDKKYTEENLLMIFAKVNKKQKKNTPKPINYLKKNTRKKFINILFCFKKLNIQFLINDYLARGLEYYNELIYEWTTKINNRRIALCAGGRYDDLSICLKGPKTYSTGCALGLERTMLKFKKKILRKIHAIVLFDNNKPLYINTQITEFIRNRLPNIVLLTGNINLSIEQQEKKAKKKKINILMKITNCNIQNKTITLITHFKKMVAKNILLKKINQHI